MRAYRTKGFTLIELLVVIAIIAVVIALAPACPAQAAREAARRNPMREQLQAARPGHSQYESTNSVLPPQQALAFSGTTVACEVAMGSDSRLLPYAEQVALQPPSNYILENERRRQLNRGLDDGERCSFVPGGSIRSDHDHQRHDRSCEARRGLKLRLVRGDWYVYYLGGLALLRKRSASAEH